uniref:Cytochrome P450 n=1 Tax=Opuntia streptacantha TaxID=393608 RepID=A0A7C8Z0K8_OPUST
MNFNPIQQSNWSLIATAILSVLFSYILLTHIIKPKKPTPPQAKGSWPILGHLPMLAPTSTPLHKTLATMADRYGPIFALRLGRHRVYIVSSHDLARECYTKNDVALASRPKMLASQHLGFNYAMLGFTPYGQYWRELRKLVTSRLLSSHRLEQLRPIRTAEVVDLVKRLGLGSNQSAGRTLVDLKREFLDLSLGIIGRVVVGKDYTKEDEKEEGRRWQRALEEVFYLFGIVVVGDFVPWLRWVDLGGHERKMKRVNKELDEILEKMIDEHRARKLNICGDQEEKDFMDVMIKLLDGTKLGGYEADHVTKATVFVSINFVIQLFENLLASHRSFVYLICFLYVDK